MLDVTQSFKDAVHSDQRQIKAKIIAHFPTGPVTFTSDDYVAEIDILEQIGSTGTNPIATMTSNSCDIVLDNTDKIFTPTNEESPYYGYLKPNVKMELFFILVTANGDEEVRAGTYYTGDWVANADSLLCSINCSDRLIKVMNTNVPPISVRRNLPIRDVFVELFTAAGLNASEYYIDPDITETVSIGWVKSGMFRDIANNLLEASFACMYVNKNNVIQVRKIINSSGRVDVWNDENQIMSIANPVRYLDVYNTVEVNYNVPIIKNNQSIASINDFELPPGQTSIDSISTMDPIVAINRVELTNSFSSNIASITITPDVLDLVLNNPTADTELVSIEIFGSIVTFTTFIHSERDLEAILEWDEKSIVIENNFVQSRSHAQWLAQNILQLSSNPNSEFVISGRGNPALELLDVIEASSVIDGIKPTLIMLTQINYHYDGGLSCDITGRTVL